MGAPEGAPVHLYSVHVTVSVYANNLGFEIIAERFQALTCAAQSKCTTSDLCSDVPEISFPARIY